MPLPVLPPRRTDSHKGDYGRALVVGGSMGMSGAVALAGMAALRSGAGLVTLAVPDVCQETVAGFEPSCMTRGLPSESEGRLTKGAHRMIAELAGRATAIGCGPGLGRSSDLVQLVERMYFELPQPMVVDADGLNALASHPDVLSRPGGPRVLTPHTGEFHRLIGKEADVTEQERRERAVDLAMRCNVVVILKGHRSLITDGHRQETNTTGNPGMATAGTGDVLTGVITALICQGLSTFDAAVLGAHVHGLAGDLAADQSGEVGMIASDLLKYLPVAFKSLVGV
jgi:ADP-dependent NAD(P)H-hydrate dehydratase